MALARSSQPSTRPTPTFDPVSGARLAEKVARGEQLQSKRPGAHAQAGQLRDRPLAHVVQVQLDARAVQLGCLLQHPLDRRLPALQQEMPAQRVDAESDHDGPWFHTATG